jgi:hypothetical protein
MLFVSWSAVSCASVWNGLQYRLFRLAKESQHAEEVFSDRHSFTLDEETHATLTPKELTLKLTAEDLSSGFRRTYVLRYRIDSRGVERIDPVALQPQDFVHEWLIRLWSEMQVAVGGGSGELAHAPACRLCERRI